jgi:hypothetical protein
MDVTMTNFDAVACNKTTHAFKNVGLRIVKAVEVVDAVPQLA